MFEIEARRVVCDVCESTLRLNGDPLRLTLPPPWRNVYVEGWAGAFHACSEECEALLRLEKEKDHGRGPTTTPGRRRRRRNSAA